MTVTIGVIGAGTVGSCQICLFQTLAADVLVSDPARRDSVHLAESARRCQAVFVCVPTPSLRPGGGVATLVLDGVIAQLSDACRRRPDPPIVAIRSTVTPDVFHGYRKAHPRLRLAANPEFLVERSALRTALFPHLLVLGGDDPQDLAELKSLYEEQSLVRPGRVVLCDPTAACLLKYAFNAFLAMKVTWANQVARLLAASGSATSWDTFADWLQADPRVGKGHLAVPGPDGKCGYGGKCLPKDLAALLHYAAGRGVDLDVLQAVHNANTRIRPADRGGE